MKFVVLDHIGTLKLILLEDSKILHRLKLPPHSPHSPLSTLILPLKHLQHHILVSNGSQIRLLQHSDSLELVRELPNAETSTICQLIERDGTIVAVHKDGTIQSLIYSHDSYEYESTSLKIQPFSKSMQVCGALDHQKGMVIYGRGFAPFAISHLDAQVIWRARNVQHDALDLKLQQHDVGAFFDEDQLLVATMDGELRKYDPWSGRRRVNCRSSLPKEYQKQQWSHFLFVQKHTMIVGCQSGKAILAVEKTEGKLHPKGMYQGSACAVLCMRLVHSHTQEESGVKLVVGWADRFIRLFEVQSCQLMVKLHMGQMVIALVEVGGGLDRQKLEDNRIEQEQREDLYKKNPKANRERLSCLKRNTIPLPYLQPRKKPKLQA